MLIPKVLFQTANKQLPSTTLAALKKHLTPDWKYEFYSDDDILSFFVKNPLDDFPDIIPRWNAVKRGAHKADYFRYYYLYVRGGMFLDSDAMLYTSLEPLLEGYDFVSVNSTHIPNSIFQGIIASVKGSPIIKEALTRAYNTPAAALERNYHTFCYQMYDILKVFTPFHKVKLYHEVKKTDHDIIVDGEKLLFKHYWKTKVIPIDSETNWNEYKKEELHTFPYTVLSTYSVPNLVRVGPKCDGGYVIVDGIDYDLFLSCAISDDLRFEDSFLSKYKIPCIAFDGSISRIPPHKNLLHWEKKNVGAVNTLTTTNLKEYMGNAKNIFLKMDIEGSEFDWINSMSTEDLSSFAQIVMEIHWPFDVYRASMLEKLNSTHYLVHLHGNNYCDRDIPQGLPSGRTYDGTVTIKCQGLQEIRLPEVFEATYIRKGPTCFKKEIQFPTPLDYPNNPLAEDISFSIPLPV